VKSKSINLCLKSKKYNKRLSKTSQRKKQTASSPIYRVKILCQPNTRAPQLPQPDFSFSALYTVVTTKT